MHVELLDTGRIGAVVNRLDKPHTVISEHGTRAGHFTEFLVLVDGAYEYWRKDFCIEVQRCDGCGEWKQTERVEVSIPSCADAPSGYGSIADLCVACKENL